MKEFIFAPRSSLTDYEWDDVKKEWKRPEIDRNVLKQLSERSTLNGLVRVGIFLFFILTSALATVAVSRYSLLLAIPVLYVYFFFYGFWAAVAHELQHKIMFAKSFDWFSEILFFVVEMLAWNSSRYARISHRLHHRYTMVHGVDADAPWPAVFTSKWLRLYLLNIILRILVVGAVVQLFRDIWTQITRIAGKKTAMMRDHCSEKDITAIRIESLAILLIHLAIAGCAIWFRRWELLIFITLAWQIGSSFELLWHSTQHICRPYNVNDHRINTRSVRVGPLVKLIYWGLNNHIDHHLFPAVPSRNLPKLHSIIREQIPEAKSLIGCWKEMFATAKEKDSNPDHEYVAVAL